MLVEIQDTQEDKKGKFLGKYITRPELCIAYSVVCSICEVSSRQKLGIILDNKVIFSKSYPL